MKFAIGYQQPENGESFADIVADYRDSLAEVFFPWVGAPSGRTALGRCGGALDLGAQCELENDLHRIRGLGIKLDLLFNANCYGELAISRGLERETKALLDYLDSLGLLPEIVTTTSPFLAMIIRKHAPGIEIRASVNMRIDSTSAMSYVADLFDSFYIRRDIQRDLTAVREVKNWCDNHNKKLLMLANSGCLPYCPAQTFHDNLMAHDAGVSVVDNVNDWNPHLCGRIYGKEKRFEEILKSSWIRPEDLELYDDLFPVVKLATRQHSHPRVVIGAYAARRFNGNLLELLEPGFAGLFAPHIIDNSRFPSDWRQTASSCVKNCRQCGKCRDILSKVMVIAGSVLFSHLKLQENIRQFEA